MDKIEFIEKVKELKYVDKDLDFEKISKSFDLYFHFLVETNEKFNLTAITEENDVYLKHFYDSLLIMNFVDLSSGKLIDIGSGAGFPGIPLAILNKNLKITLVESSKKKCGFLEELSKKLELNNVEIICARAEDLPKTLQNLHNFGTCRAVSALNIVTELVLPFIKIGGYFIPYKSSKFDEELKSSTKTIKLLGGNLEKVEKTNLTEDDEIRVFPFIEKTEKTLKKYPRKYSDILNKPLN